MTDEGSRAFLPVEATCLGTVNGVWGLDGPRFAVSPSIDAAWDINGWETELGNHVSRQRATYLQDGLTNLRDTT